MFPIQTGMKIKEFWFDFHCVAKNITEVNGSRKYLVIIAFTDSFVFRVCKQVGNDMIFG